MLPDFGDYIIFVDESGTPTLTTIDAEYPIFVLVFCVVEKNHYADVIQPALKKLKFEFFGHDMIVLHANAIRKPTSEFSFLQNASLRALFMERLNNILKSADIKLIAQVIHKDKLKQKYVNPFDPYNIALRMCLEKVHRYLKTKNQHGKLTHIIAESRGKTEDATLALEFQRIIDPAFNWGEANLFDLGITPFELKFVEKKINSAGLQLADLAGQPIGRYIMAPQVTNRAFEIIKEKIWNHIVRFP